MAKKKSEVEDITVKINAVAHPGRVRIGVNGNIRYLPVGEPVIVDEGELEALNNSSVDFVLLSGEAASAEGSAEAAEPAA